MIAQIDGRYFKMRPQRLVPRLLSYALFEGRPLTTRGRWINPLIFGLFSIEKRLPQLKKIDKPVFIVGTGRSGTTALGIVMSMHRDVGFLNEPKAMWHAIYPHEDLIGSYTRGAAKYRLSENDFSDSVDLTAHRLFGSYLFATGTRRVVDKYPELIFRVPFVRAIFPDAKFLFLVRNGWDTCRSIDIWSERKGINNRNEAHDWWGVNRRKWDLLVEQVAEGDPDLSAFVPELRQLTSYLDMAAVEWILTMRQGLAMREKYPGAVHLVHYEDLTAQPERVLRTILQFCELEPDPVFLRYGREILHRSPPREPFDLHPKIRPAFEKVMHTLGYATGAGLESVRQQG